MKDSISLNRFLEAQDRNGMFEQALSELRAGRKTSHWIWYVFPQISGLFTTDILLMVAGVVLACGVLICLLATFFTVNKLALASEDSLYY